MAKRDTAKTRPMFKFNIDIPKEPIVNIKTTENRGFTPDEVAERCVEKLISVSEGSHPAIRDQANAFKKHKCRLPCTRQPRAGPPTGASGPTHLIASVRCHFSH